MIIEHKDPPGEKETRPADRLEALAPGFDTFMIGVGPAAWVSVVVPRAGLIARCPSYPKAALPATGRVANGCGLDPDRTRISGLGEAVELASCCTWGDEMLVRARADDLPSGTMRPQEVTGFSPAQIRARIPWNRRYESFDWRPRSYRGDDIDWIVGMDAVSGAAVHLPADAVLIGRRLPGDGAAVAIADSNGCAAGETPEQAMEAALLELIERDATGRWWYARRRRPTLPATLLDGWPALARWLEMRARPTVLLDLTTDIGIPVAAALSSAPDGSLPALGFAARFGMAEAAGAAVAEMLGVEAALPQGQDRLDPQANEWLARGPAAMPGAGPAAAKARVRAPPDPEHRLALAIGALDRAGCRIAFVDLTRPAFGVPVFRAVAPDLCHCKPRFGRRRMLAPDVRDLAQARATRPNPVPLLV